MPDVYTVRSLLHSSKAEITRPSIRTSVPTKYKRYMGLVVDPPGAND
jgi:hypothetical protein